MKSKRTKPPEAVAVATLLVLGLGCTPPASDDELPPQDAGSSGATEVDEGSDDSPGSSETGEPDAEPVTACSTPTDVHAAPATIAEAVAFINALPHPVTLDCFLERLDRPLQLASTTSTISLQPAVGERSPRVFLFQGDLIMSVAIDREPGTTLLEFGELVNETKSIKGELEFPVSVAIDIDAPFDRVADEVGSECRICHGGEEADPTYEGSFSSDALNFRDDQTVELATVLAEFMACDPQDEPKRCARLHALFGYGPVQDGRFPDTLPTIFDYE